MKRFLLLMLGLLVLGAAGVGYVGWSRLQGLAPEALETRYMAPTDRFIDVGGLKVRVREEGPEGAPPIILIHGFIMSLESFDDWARALSSEYRVIRFDLAGHGLTGPDPQKRYAPTERAALIGDLMDALSLDRAIIGGNSLGGLAAWRFAAENPERVDALLLISPGGFPTALVGDTPVAPPQAMVAFLKFVPEAGVRQTAEAIWSDDSKITPERLKTISDMMRRRGNGDAFIDSINEFSLPDPTADLAKIAAPTLILWGEDDVVIPVAQSEQMAKAIPSAKLVRYPGVGHVAHEEAAEASAAEVRAFLAALPTAQASAAAPPTRWTFLRRIVTRLRAG